jgi:hypothetical protein
MIKGSVVELLTTLYHEGMIINFAWRAAIGAAPGWP